MKFGRIDTHAAEGGILSHSIMLPARKLQKGSLLTTTDLADLMAAGIAEVVIARLEEGDMGEDEAAGRIAAAVTGRNVLAECPATGRCNLHAASGGLLAFDAADMVELNLVDEALTIATLPRWSVVQADDLLATIKVIPFGVGGETVTQLVDRASSAACRLDVHPFRRLRVGLLQTRVDGLAERVLDKTTRVTGRRLAQLGNELAEERRCAHRETDIAAGIAALLDAGCELLLVAGASATADRRDVVPLGIEQGGGRIVHLGMPVEPGNLLMLAEARGGIPVVCLPGCARSPALNGFDWVLERLLAGLPVTGIDIMSMAAGGLIKGAPSRLPKVERSGPGGED